jgi:hypothetical protein
VACSHDTARPCTGRKWAKLHVTCDRMDPAPGATNRSVRRFATWGTFM